MKTILVTGANGQLGLTLKDIVQNKKGYSFIFLSKTELDISNKKETFSYFEKYNFDYCINCAAYTNVEQAEKTPKIAYKINAEGVKNLAEFCKRFNTILIHISTDYVFDGEKIEPYTIEDRPNPINEYGKSKLMGEKYIQEILKNYLIIRTSWLYSKKYGKNFYKTILKLAESQPQLFVTDEQIGSPTDALNLANFIISIIRGKITEYGLHHFSDNKAMTWYDFAKVILKENKIKKEVVPKSFDTFAARPKNSVLLNSIPINNEYDGI